MYRRTKVLVKVLRIDQEGLRGTQLTRQFAELWGGDYVNLLGQTL